MVSQSGLDVPNTSHVPLGMRVMRLIVLGILATMAILVPTLRFIHHGLTGDVWWTWKAGQWMALRHTILLHDPAAWNGPSLAGKPWINLEWGWEWLLYTFAPRLHPLNFLIVLLLLQWAILLSFSWAMRTVAPRLMPELAALSYFVYQVVFLDLKLRAEMVSYAFFPLLLTLLWKGRENVRWLWLLAPLAAIWANIHGSWLLIVVFSGLEVLWALIQRRWATARAMALWGLLLPLAIAVLFTPNHFKTLTYAIWLDHNHYITTYIQEWQSANFHLLSMAVLGLTVFAAWVWRAHRREPSPLILDVWFAGAAFMSFDEVRMLPYFGVIFLLWIAYGLSEYAACRDRWPPLKRSHLWYTAVFLAGWAAASLITLPHLTNRFMTRQMPTAIITWLNRHPHAGVFAPYSDGGYLIAHNVRDVYIDGRADLFLYNGDRFQSYVRIISASAFLPPQVARVFRQADVDRIAWPAHQLDANLTWFLVMRHWHTVYASNGWKIYAP